MEVEKKVGSPANKMSAKTKLAILFSVLGVLIVGIVIAIVIIVVNRNNRTSNGDTDVNINVEESTEEISDEEVVESYEDISREITLKIVEAQEVADNGGEGIDLDLLLNLLKEKIESVKNEKIKAMLAADYYMSRLSQNPGEDAKDEIMNGLYGVDDILKTSDSAFKVMNAAVYFADQELANKYYAIGMERAAAEDANRATEDNTEGTDGGEEETVG